MTYKDWTKEQLAAAGKRLNELIPLAKLEMMSKGVAYHREYLTAIYKAEITLEELRKEYKCR